MFTPPSHTPTSTARTPAPSQIPAPRPTPPRSPDPTPTLQPADAWPFTTRPPAFMAQCAADCDRKIIRRLPWPVAWCAPARPSSVTHNAWAFPRLIFCSVRRCARRGLLTVRLSSFVRALPLRLSSHRSHTPRWCVCGSRDDDAYPPLSPAPRLAGCMRRHTPPCVRVP